MTAWLRRRIGADDRGFTLIEVLMAMIMTLMVMGTMLSVVLATNRSGSASKQANDLNEEARVAINRISRELREAQKIDAVTLDPATGQFTGLTFEVDFNGNGVIDANAPDPEVLTYCYDKANSRLLLTPSVTPSTCNNPSALPILASDVTKFSLGFDSNLWKYDANGDGVTTWQELDAAGAPVGNNNGVLDVELSNINTVHLDMTVLKNQRQQRYRTQIDIRNQN